MLIRTTGVGEGVEKLLQISSLVWDRGLPQTSRKRMIMPATEEKESSTSDNAFMLTSCLKGNSAAQQYQTLASKLKSSIPEYAHFLQSDNCTVQSEQGKGWQTARSHSFGAGGFTRELSYDMGRNMREEEDEALSAKVAKELHERENEQGDLWVQTVQTVVSSKSGGTIFTQVSSSSAVKQKKETKVRRSKRTFQTPGMYANGGRALASQHRFT